MGLKPARMEKEQLALHPPRPLDFTGKMSRALGLVLPCSLTFSPHGRPRLTWLVLSRLSSVQGCASTMREAMKISLCNPWSSPNFSEKKTPTFQNLISAFKYCAQLRFSNEWSSMFFWHIFMLLSMWKSFWTKWVTVIPKGYSFTFQEVFLK